MSLQGRSIDTPAKVMIIGSGPAGYTAAIYAARADLAPILFQGSQPGGQLMTTTDVENYPGFPKGIGGIEMMEAFTEQARRFNTEILESKIISVKKGEKNLFSLTDDNEQTFWAHSVIVATGASAKILGEIEGHQRFWQKGISACAVCDGALPLFRNKVLVVVGGGDTAMEEASFLAKFASKVIIVHRRDQFRASQIMQQRVLSHPKIEVMWNSEVVAAHGKELLTHVAVKQKDQTISIEAAGLFYAIGHTPNTSFVSGLAELLPNGYIRVFEGTQTSVQGLFACGDCVDFHYRQAITAAGDGCKAALDAERYLSTLGV